MTETWQEFPKVSLMQELTRIFMGLTRTSDRFPKEVTRVLFAPALREPVYLFWPAG